MGSFTLLPPRFVLLTGNVDTRYPEPLLALALLTPTLLILPPHEVVGCGKDTGWGASWVWSAAHCICSCKLVPFKVSLSYFCKFPKELSHMCLGVSSLGF